MYTLSKEEYNKFHAFKGAKEMRDILVITYERLSEEKRNKLSLLTKQYKLFSMLDNENKQAIFNRFQTILKEWRSLGKIYENFDNIDKILCKFPRQWRSQVTTHDIEKSWWDELKRACWDPKGPWAKALVGWDAENRQKHWSQVLETS